MDGVAIAGLRTVRRIRPGYPTARDGYDGYIRARLGPRRRPA